MESKRVIGLLVNDIEVVPDVDKDHYDDDDMFTIEIETYTGKGYYTIRRNKDQLRKLQTKLQKAAGI